jgi:hypothetical protein
MVTNKRVKQKAREKKTESNLDQALDDICRYENKSSRSNFQPIHFFLTETRATIGEPVLLCLRTSLLVLPRLYAQEKPQQTPFPHPKAFLFLPFVITYPLFLKDPVLARLQVLGIDTTPLANQQANWYHYRKRIPVCGCILLNETLDKVRCSMV